MLEVKHVVGNLYIINNKLIQHLPLNNSLIPYFIMINVMHYFLEDKALSMKVLSNELTCSHNGTKKQLQVLIKDKWLTVINSQTDKRVKLIRPSKKLITKFSNLSFDVLPHFKIDH